MKKSKNKRAVILAIILLGLLIIAYKTTFTSAPIESIGVNMAGAEASLDDSAVGILNEIESINFDMSITEDQNFKSLRSIEIPLMSLPVGRKNPFSSVSNSN
jgi:hypothetical protein